MSFPPQHLFLRFALLCSKLRRLPRDEVIAILNVRLRTDVIEALARLVPEPSADQRLRFWSGGAGPIPMTSFIAFMLDEHHGPFPFELDVLHSMVDAPLHPTPEAALRAAFADPHLRTPIPITREQWAALCDADTLEALLNSMHPSFQFVPPRFGVTALRPIKGRDISTHLSLVNTSRTNDTLTILPVSHESDTSIEILPWFASYAFTIDRPSVVLPALDAFASDADEITGLPSPGPLAVLYIDKWAKPRDQSLRVRSAPVKRKRDAGGAVAEMASASTSRVYGSVTITSVQGDAFTWRPETPLEGMGAFLQIRFQRLPALYDQFAESPELGIDDPVLITPRFELIHNLVLPITVLVGEETRVVSTEEELDLFVRLRVDHERVVLRVSELVHALHIACKKTRVDCDREVLQKIMRKFGDVPLKTRAAIMMSRVSELMEHQEMLAASPPVVLPRTAPLWARVVGMHGPTVEEASRDPSLLVALEGHVHAALAEGVRSLFAADPVLMRALGAPEVIRWSIAFVPGVLLRQIVLCGSMWDDGAWWAAHSAAGWASGVPSIATSPVEIPPEEGVNELVRCSFSCRRPSPLLALFCPFADAERAPARRTLIVLARARVIEDLSVTRGSVAMFNNALSFLAHHLPRVARVDWRADGPTCSRGRPFVHLVSDACSTTLMTVDLRAMERANDMTTGTPVVSWARRDESGSTMALPELARGVLKSLDQRKNNVRAELELAATLPCSVAVQDVFNRPLFERAHASATPAGSYHRCKVSALPCEGKMDARAALARRRLVPVHSLASCAAIDAETGIPVVKMDEGVGAAIASAFIERFDALSQAFTVYSEIGARRFSYMMTWANAVFNRICGERSVFPDANVVLGYVAEQLLHGVLFNGVSGQLWRTDFVGCRAYLRDPALVKETISLRDVFRMNVRGHAVTNGMPRVGDEAALLAQRYKKATFLPRHVPIRKTNDERRLIVAAFWAFAAAGSRDSCTARVPLDLRSHSAWRERTDRELSEEVRKAMNASRLLSHVRLCARRVLDEASPYTTIVTRNNQEDTFSRRLIATFRDVPVAQRSEEYSALLLEHGFVPRSRAPILKCMEHVGLLNARTFDLVMDGPADMGLTSLELPAIPTRRYDVDGGIHAALVHSAGVAVATQLAAFISRTGIPRWSDTSIDDLFEEHDIMADALQAPELALPPPSEQDVQMAFARTMGTMVW